MKRLSGYRASGPDLDRVAGGLEEDLDSPLYASPTAYGYAKIGSNKMKSSPATTGVICSSLSCLLTLNLHPCRVLRLVEAEPQRPRYWPASNGELRGRASSHLVTLAIWTSYWAGQGRWDSLITLLRQIFYFLHVLQAPPSRQSSGIFENIKEKAKHGFSATKRNFL